MRQGRSSNKIEIKEMEIDKLSKIKEEPHLSGAYIRSLVKQLTSSKTKDTMNNHPKDPDCVVVDGDGDGFPGQNLTKLAEDLSQNQRSSNTNSNSTHQTQQPQQHKKQVRRRLHTTRPYQERLLNMAEARREIVTALKFHRAAMKQASEQQNQQQQQEQQQQQQPPEPQLPQPQMIPCFEQEEKIKSRRNHRVYPSSTANFSNYLENRSYTSNNFPHQPPPPNPFSWPASPIPSLPICENLNFQLPNQALGLNLNFQDFNNIDTSLYHRSSSNNPSSFYSSSSPTSSSSHSISIATDHEFSGSATMLSQAELGPPMTVSTAADVATTSGGGGGGGGLHAAMDDEEMAEIRSIGEQHQMEWNDTMNLVTSAWWFKFLKSMELGAPNVKTEDDDENIDGFRPFDEVMEFPAWLSSNESCFDQHHFDDYYCSDDYFQAPALPW